MMMLLTRPAACLISALDARGPRCLAASTATHYQFSNDILKTGSRPIYESTWVLKDCTKERVRPSFGRWYCNGLMWFNILMLFPSCKDGLAYPLKMFKPLTMQCTVTVSANSDTTTNTGVDKVLLGNLSGSFVIFSLPLQIIGTIWAIILNFFFVSWEGCSIWNSTQSLGRESLSRTNS